MKRLILLMIVIALMLPVRAAAAELSVFDKDIAGIEESIPEGSREAFSELGIASVSDLISKGIDLSSLLLYAGGLVQRYADTPFSVMLLLIIIIILTAVAESYSFSLRYTDTREIMGVVVSLYLAAALISPISGLIDSSVKVIERFRDVKYSVDDGIIYSEVNALLDGTADDALREKYAPVYEELFVAKELADILKAKAAQRGELEIESSELRFVLDENGGRRVSDRTG